MQEELDKVTQRDFPINLKGIRVVAVNVVKLKTDNVDPRALHGPPRGLAEAGRDRRRRASGA